MVYQVLYSGGRVHCHVGKEKHLFVKDWHCPNVLESQEQTQFQH